MFNCEIIQFYISVLKSSWLVSRGESIHFVDAKLFTIGAVELSLDLNGQSGKCAGVVQYKTKEGKIFGVCKSDWSKWTKTRILFLICTS